MSALLDNLPNTIICAICTDDINNEFENCCKLSCNHIFHDNCMCLLIRSNLSNICPLCRTNINETIISKFINFEINIDDFFKLDGIRKYDTFIIINLNVNCQVIATGLRNMMAIERISTNFNTNCGIIMSKYLIGGMNIYFELTDVMYSLLNEYNIRVNISGLNDNCIRNINAIDDIIKLKKTIQFDDHNIQHIKFKLLRSSRITDITNSKIPKTIKDVPSFSRGGFIFDPQHVNTYDHNVVRLNIIQMYYEPIVRTRLDRFHVFDDVDDDDDSNA